MPPERLRVGRPRRSADSPHRIEADVDGAPVWFESTDVTLVPAPEAWASAFLIPALSAGRTLEIETPVDALWAGHLPVLIRRLCRAWGYRRRSVSLVVDRAAPPAAAQPRARGLFFSGGVDSFHALLCTDERPQALVHVHGFDVPLPDAARRNAAEQTVRAVAASAGVRPVFLTTNLREHPSFRTASWDASHGGALAAAGHVLSGTLQRIAIASSQSRGTGTPWGSHWSTDPLWSRHAIEFVHLAPDVERIAKIRAVAADPLVRAHLRVCWKQSGAQVNCGRCEKCMLTMLALHDAGALPHVATFTPTDLLALVRTRKRSRWRMRMLRSLIVSPRLEPELRRALVAMYLRSLAFRGPAGGLLRRLSEARHAFRSARRAAPP